MRIKIRDPEIVAGYGWEATVLFMDTEPQQPYIPPRWGAGERRWPKWVGGAISLLWVFSFNPGSRMRQFNVPTIGERLMRAVMGREVGVVGTVIWVFSVPVLVGVVLLIVGAIQRRKYH